MSELIRDRARRGRELQDSDGDQAMSNRAMNSVNNRQLAHAAGRAFTLSEMLVAVEAALPADVAICAAAVADWRPSGLSEGKIKKREGAAPPVIELAATPIRFHHFRHEAGAGFAAIEAHFATGRPGLCVVTTGPGLFNVLNPAMAARVDGARLLVVSGFTAPALVGRGAVQETCLRTMPSELSRPGSIFHAKLVRFLMMTLKAFFTVASVAR